MSTRIINTFIFLDLETTGFINGNLMPKVTEMSLIAVTRNAMCNSRGALPRVLQKLVLAINPNKTIPERVKNLTGLSNNSLGEVECFDYNTYDLMVKFLNRQTAPVCLVAYNGNRFDYPILLSELKSINQTLGENILSIDMLYLVKEFFSLKKTSIPDYDSLLNDGCDEILSNALDKTMKWYVLSINENNSCNNVNCTGETKETVPIFNDASKSTSSESSDVKIMQAINEKTPESQILRSLNPNNRIKDCKAVNVKRNLNFCYSTPSNFKLSTVFKHICGAEPENAHTAESDCLSMIQCAVRIEDFVQRADSIAVPLINFSKA